MEKTQNEGLESRVPKLANWGNEVIVPTDNGNVVYVGNANHLHFKDGNVGSIGGAARLTRYERMEENENKIEIVQLFPPKFQFKEITNIKDKKEWEVDTLGGCGYSGSYFISDGRLVGNSESYGYRGKLLATAANEGIVLSPQLLDKVFGPIDTEIMKQYRSYK